jgi:hypothetical protein
VLTELDGETDADSDMLALGLTEADTELLGEILGLNDELGDVLDEGEVELEGLNVEDGLTELLGLIL